MIYESSKIRRCDWSKHVEFSTVAMRITVSMYENCYAIGSKWHHENEILGEISFFVIEDCFWLRSGCKINKAHFLSC